MYYWAVEWRQKNKLDGVTKHWLAKFFTHRRDPIYTGSRLALFRTRREARAWVKEHYGYIARRPDLRAEPHGWKMPRVAKVKVVLVEVGK